MQQVLLVALRARPREFVRQPVVMADELRQELLAVREDALFIAPGPLDQAGEGLNEAPESGDVFQEQRTRLANSTSMPGLR